MVLYQAQQGTGNGNLTLVVNNDGYTIGDTLCDKADSVEENVQNKYVRIYWRLCGESWQRTHFRMSQQLCCIDGLYVPCDKIKNY
ncbi:uncharacterized protein LOC143256695 [Tachypleus tridentatus]|uniref:uncharacterized protein LOC143256695 n=1 Tax=Tachypleus tridentatus TaxID=6853 RepID=UPI003FD0350F